MPYVSLYVQVFPSTTPNLPITLTHGLDNPEVLSVEINSDDSASPVVPFTWSVLNAEQISVTSSIDLGGCWIVVRAI